MVPCMTLAPYLVTTDRADARRCAENQVAWVQRLDASGATVLAEHGSPAMVRWTVLGNPEVNAFCAAG